MDNRRGVGIFRNIGGQQVFIELVAVDPFSIKLDIKNPRISHPLTQLPDIEQNDAACELLLSTQEDVDTLQKSIRQTRGVQDPIYITHDGVVVEGNRRVVALRELKQEYPDDQAFEKIPAWIIPINTPSSVIDDLINAAHLDPKRPWAPFERSLVLRRLSEAGLDSGTLAERYEMVRSEVIQFIEAANLMLQKFFPKLENPDDPQATSKFSYFLEYIKGRMSKYRQTMPGLDDKFCEWVRDGKIPRADSVRSLPKILNSEVAVAVLEQAGLKAAMAALADEDPAQHQFYGNLVAITRRMERIGADELYEIQSSPQKQEILHKLQEQINMILKIVKR